MTTDDVPKIIDNKPKLLEFVKDAIVYGDFLLSSGNKADFYVNIKKIYGNPAALRILENEFWNITDKNATCIAANGYGGIPPAAVISATHHLAMSVVREQVKDHGLQNIIEGYVPTAQDKIIIIDDVLSTGKTLQSMITTLRPTGATILAAYVVVQRGDGAVDIPVTSLFKVEEILRP